MSNFHGHTNDTDSPLLLRPIFSSLFTPLLENRETFSSIKQCFISPLIDNESLNFDKTANEEAVGVEIFR